MQRLPLRSTGGAELGVLLRERRGHHGLGLDIDRDALLRHWLLDGGDAIGLLDIDGVLGGGGAVHGLNRAELARGRVNGAHPLRSGRNAHDGPTH